MLPDSVALFSDNLYVYWHGILFAFAILSVILLACILRKIQTGDYTDAMLSAVVSFPVALLLGRVHYCFLTERTGGFLQLDSLAKGGYGLYGAMLGVFICVVVIAKIRRSSIPEMLDAVSLAG
ncbi:MAG: prolipoprotein diacylglyceryl transferase, partial [Clostridia bacterium]|nr:prolipoprotein diacylglyceryl transferase [Clostridia bacterium]